MACAVSKERLAHATGRSKFTITCSIPISSANNLVALFILSFGIIEPDLFITTQQNVSQHIQNIYEEGELVPEATNKKFLSVRQEGQRQVQRNLSITTH